MEQIASSSRLRGAAFGLGAAILFGLSAPLAKALLPQSGPLMLAGLLYLGAGIGLSAMLAGGPGHRAADREARVRRADLPLLAGIIAAGGVAGPILMMFGLTRLSAVAGSLLLNLEGIFTILIAVTLFGEHLGIRELAASLLVIAGAAALGLGGGQMGGDFWGVAAIAAACLCWGLDNNLTQRLSIRDPIEIVRIKALAAGTVTLIIALVAGAALPRTAILAAALLLGLFSYGASIVMDVYALRYLGAAREAAFFATAPFVGALAAMPLLGERFTAGDLAAAAAMAAGVAVMLREHHDHLHVHGVLEHEHSHVHDAHHQHEHPPGMLVTEPHSHPHRHERLEHQHPHVSDLHHRHRHD